jgi:integrase
MSAQRACANTWVVVGLRREELAQLRIEDLQQREGRRCLVDLAGKGNRLRTVAIPDWAHQAADEWIAAMPFSTGLLLSKINKGWAVRGARHVGGLDLRRRERVCREAGARTEAARSEVHLRQARPQGRGTHRADPTELRARLPDDDRALSGNRSGPRRCALRSPGTFRPTDENVIRF